MSLAIKENTNNVIGFNNNSFYNSLQLYISGKSNNSKCTATNYLSHYKEFFYYMTGKELNDVTWDDVQKITYTRILKYRDEYLSKKDVSAKTINIKMAALRSLYKHLYDADKDMDVNISLQILKIQKLKEHKRDKNPHGSLTLEEIALLYDYALSVDYKPLLQKMFFEFAIVTGLRKNAILNLKWSDIKQKVDKNTNRKIWVVCAVDKGSEDVEKAISDDLYTRLRETYENEKIFNVCDKTLDETLKGFCKKYDISNDRHIVIHSLRKTSSDIVYALTKDVNATARHLSHKDVKMVYETYQGQNESYANQPSYRINEIQRTYQENIDKLSQLSKDELLNLFKQCDNEFLNDIVSKI